MGVLTTAELQSVRNACADSVQVNYTKSVINAAAQACEDFLVQNATAVSTVINTATSPTVLSNAQKKKLFAEVVMLKYLRDR